MLVNQNAFYAIEFRFAHTIEAAARNNLCDAPIHLRDQAAATLSGNVLDATPALFENPVAGDLHLRRAALARVPGISSVTNDFDAQPRPQNGLVTVGADEPSLGGQ